MGCLNLRFRTTDSSGVSTKALTNHAFCGICGCWPDTADSLHAPLPQMLRRAPTAVHGIG